jgi:sorbitol/mannitol transport system substrate-binding protein
MRWRQWLGKRGNWLWAWSLAIPAGTQKADAAQKFVSWATSKAYLELVASKEGWANVPPGTRSSLYANAEYQKAAPFAKMTLDSINAADPTHPTVKPVPYVGVQFVAIPEFQGLGGSARSSRRRSPGRAASTTPSSRPRMPPPAP